MTSPGHDYLRVSSFMNRDYWDRKWITISNENEIYLYDNEEVRVYEVPISIASFLQFPSGHPRIKGLYVGNPVIKYAYYPVERFHRTVFESKVSEAVHLLESLGTSHLEIEVVEGWSNVGNLNLPLVLASGEMSSTNKSRIHYTADYQENHSFELPKDMFWYAQETQWQQLARSRLKYGMQRFKLTVENKNDFGVNSKLAIKVSKFLDLSIEAKYENHKHTTWVISGEFTPNRT